MNISAEQALREALIITNGISKKGRPYRSLRVRNAATFSNIIIEMCKFYGVDEIDLMDFVEKKEAKD